MFLFREGLNPYLMHGRFGPQESTHQIALLAYPFAHVPPECSAHTHHTDEPYISGQLAIVIISHYLFVRFTDEKVTHKIHLHQ